MSPSLATVLKTTIVIWLIPDRLIAPLRLKQADIQSTTQKGCGLQRWLEKSHPKTVHLQVKNDQ